MGEPLLSGFNRSVKNERYFDESLLSEFYGVMQYAVHSTSHQKKRELQPIYFPPKNAELPPNVVIYILIFLVCHP